ncbi:aminoacyl-tRNA hydrolase [Candidatus Dependentiae bacterium]
MSSNKSVIHGFDVENLSQIRAIVGLGNPGTRYEKTRHNVGFMVVDKIASHVNATWSLKGEILWTDINSTFNALSEKSLVLCKPTAYMNNSGIVVSALKKRGIQPEETIVVHDELEKKFGKISIRLGGSARGHNGLRSIIGQWGDNFWRLRMGIGRPENKADVSNYVLSNFFPEESEYLEEFLDNAAEIFTAKTP